MTQRDLAKLLGITVRSVQNYESGAIVPYRHLSRIEVLTQRRRGWLLSDDEGEGRLDASVAELLAAMERHHSLLRDHLDAIRDNVDRLKTHREALERRPRRAV